MTRFELADGYKVARVINGGWQLSRGHREHDRHPDTVLAELQKLVDAGLTTFDCGDIYIGVEALLGKLLARQPPSRRATIEVHTKFVPDLDELPRIDRAYVEKIIHRSLRRLGVECLDLVQLAWWNYDVPGYVETARWLDDLRRAGKIRLLGATNFDVPHLAEIVEAGVPITSHQVQYSLLDRRPERGMIDLCQGADIHLLAYGSLAGGFLSDRYLGRPAPEPPLANRSLVKYLLIIAEMGGWERFQKLLGVLSRIAHRHQASIANIALRWVLEQPGMAAAIIGAFDATHLEDNLRALRLGLDEEDHRLLEPFAGVGPQGDVYEAERIPGGPHAVIMKYNLNREAQD